jgi:curli biogenesis system outer membrane secretion channel CsgG
MRKVEGALIGIFLIICGCVPASIQQTTIVTPFGGVIIPSAVQRIAVTEFVDGRQDKSSFPNPAPELQEKIINGLVMKNVSVIERQHLNRIIAEQALGQTGMLDEQTAIRVGGILGVDAIIVGQVVDYGKIITPVAKLDLICRLIDVKSGKILFALQVNARKKNLSYPFELHREVIDESVAQVLNAIN